MKLSALLNQRRVLLQQAQLANLAFAYDRLSGFAARIERGGLSGEVRLQHPALEGDRYWSSLTALEGNQSVIEEHFTDEDITDLADIVAFSSGKFELDITFRMEELGGRFLHPLRLHLKRAGVDFDEAQPLHDDASSGGQSGQAQLDGKG
ncbi:MAG TPA: hypothetical protein VGM64_11180 [Lacunisphaera sp.]|jgi:hypothetical protein